MLFMVGIFAVDEVKQEQVKRYAGTISNTTTRLWTDCVVLDEVK
jgi:hypothetical protein